MEIRKTTPEQLPQLLSIYERARQFMASTGNPRQWGPRQWPPQELLRKDIARGKSYVCMDRDTILGTFYYDFGPDIEPTYAHIDDGQWLYDTPYGVVHRIAASGAVKGTGRFCLEWAKEQSGHLRIDTHGDNRVMQNLLRSLGFVRTGTIYVYEDNDPRFAYEWIRS